MRRGDGLWIVAVGLLLLWGSGLFPQSFRRDSTGSFSVASSGKQAFFSLLELLLREVHRNTEHLVPPEDADTLLILGPARYPDRAEWNRLHDWVSSGKALVFAARWQDPAIELEPFGVRIVRMGATPSDSGAPFATESPGALETPLAHGDLDWKSVAHVETSSTEAQTFVSRQGRAQVVRQSVGAGVLVVVSSDYVFHNRTLASTDTGVLAFRIVELAAPAGPVYFDEWINEAGSPKIVGLLFDEPLRALTFQLLICGALFAWRTSRHFGARRLPDSAPRRSLREHAEALGNLHFKIGSAAHVASAYFDHFRRDLGVRNEQETARLLAERAGSERESVSRLIHRAARASRNPQLASSSAAQLIRELATLRRKCQRGKGVFHGP